ncbi:MAG: hypothetical protein ACXVXJ_08660 [Mycobacteriaceae bacterium]
MLMFVNVLSFTVITPLVFPLPSTAGKAITQAALACMLLVALSLNPRGVIRPNVYLTILTVFALIAVPLSFGNTFWLGSVYRSVRLLVFLATLWLLTPWWGRLDMPLLRVHLRSMIAILGTVLLGLAIAPGRALAFSGRLAGVLWPIPPTQVAHYAAIVVGCTVVLWLCRLISRRRAVILVAVGVAMLLATHTRTALVAMLVGVLVAGLSLFLGRSRARKAFVWATGATLVGAVMFAPAITTWLARGQTGQQATDLTGRADVWQGLLAVHRPELRSLFGYGLSNKSFNGLSIDSTWIATYQDSGLVGCGLVGMFLLALVLAALFAPPGPARAVALFLIAYDVVASFTEVGLGDASPYLLDLAVAASLLACSRRAKPL